MRHFPFPVADDVCIAFESLGRQVCTCARCVALSTAITVGAIGCERAGSIGAVEPVSCDEAAEVVAAEPVVTPLREEMPVVSELAPDRAEPTRRRAPVVRRSAEAAETAARDPVDAGPAAPDADVLAEEDEAPARSEPPDLRAGPPSRREKAQPTRAPAADPVIDSYSSTSSRSALQPPLPPGRY